MQRVSEWLNRNQYVESPPDSPRCDYPKVKDDDEECWERLPDEDDDEDEDKINIRPYYPNFVE